MDAADIIRNPVATLSYPRVIEKEKRRQQVKTRTNDMFYETLEPLSRNAVARELPRHNMAETGPVIKYQVLKQL